MQQPLRIILVIESTRAYGRGCLQGIASYARTHGPWTFLHIERGLDEELPAGLHKWNGHGVIARIETQHMARSLARLDLPTVDLRGRQLLPGAASLNTDPVATARLAIEHFSDRGFKHLAFCGFPGVDFSDERSAAFASLIQALRISIQIFAPRRPGTFRDTTGQELRGSLHDAELIQWLRSLPKPVAILACNDARGRQVLAACARSHLRVPEDVAVLGVDNDPVLCDLSDPPLSSVAPDVEAIGRRGAEILAGMIRTGKKRSRIVETMPPRTVVTRRSSDILAIDDPEVSAAMHLIRQRAFGSFTVENLLDELTISRATLERRFKAMIGRSPKQEILNTRLARVRQLLIETNDPLSSIATVCGFKTAAHLSVTFRHAHGQSPGAYRAGLKGDR